MARAAAAASGFARPSRGHNPAVTGRISVVHEPEGVRLVLAGEFDTANHDRLVLALRRHRGTSLTIDLSAVTFVDSSVLRTLLAESRHARLEDRILRVVRGPEEVHRVFRVTGLEPLFDWE